METMETLAGRIDHTCLKPDANRKMIHQICQEASEYNFASVCVNPYWVPLCKDLLATSSAKVCTVIGFPLGCSYTEIKAEEVSQALEKGAEEFDMVLNISALKSEDFEKVHRDIQSVVEAAQGHTVKVILETCLLSQNEIIKACQLAEEAGAHFVKTSTGFSKGGATVEAIELMKKTVGDRLKVKASGGIKDRETALRFIEAGADRLGASAGVAIINGASSSEHY